MTRYASSGGQPSLRTWSRSWEVQSAPYRSPLPFRYTFRNETQYPFSYYPGYQTDDYVAGLTNPSYADSLILDRMRNAARIKAVDKMKEGRSAALGLTLVDWRKSLSTIAGALKSLVSKASRKKLYYRRKSSDLYLEGVFGWLPLINDIYDACGVLSGAHRSSPVRAKSTTVETQMFNGSTFVGSLQREIGVQVGGSGRMVNPNLALLSDLGLINPAAVLWDKVPFSFVVNWFIPVGTYLNSLTDLVGYEVSDGFVTEFVRKTGAGQILVYNRDSQKYEWRSRTVVQLSVYRGLGFPSMSLPQFHLPSGDLFKAITSLALLDQKMRS